MEAAEEQCYMEAAEEPGVKCNVPNVFRERIGYVSRVSREKVIRRQQGAKGEVVAAWFKKSHVDNIKEQKGELVLVWFKKSNLLPMINNWTRRH